MLHINVATCLLCVMENITPKIKKEVMRRSNHVEVVKIKPKNHYHDSIDIGSLHCKT